MIKEMMFFLLVFFFALELSPILLADEPQFTLTAKSGTLSWTEKGLTLTPAFEAPTIQGTRPPVWSLQMLSIPNNPESEDALPPQDAAESKSQADPAKLALANAEGNVILNGFHQEFEQKSLENGVELFYPFLKTDEHRWNVSVRLTILQEGHGFQFFASIENHEPGWVVQMLNGPIFQGIDVDTLTYPVLCPEGAGKQISIGAAEIEAKNMTPAYHNRYPGVGCTMQWLAFAGEKSGLYLGSPDETRSAKEFEAKYLPDVKQWRCCVRTIPLVQPNETWSNVLFEIFPYQGSWHKAADHYRAWVDSTNFVRPKPQWLKKNAGMITLIMKQQNGRHVMWKYSDIGTKICDAADEQGIDMIALFGWAHGGHDHLYPDYFPDELLGGREALREGIAKAHERGKRVYLYANGYLMDQTNDRFWNEMGHSIAIKNRDGSLCTETWKKFLDTPGYTFGRACLWDDRWYTQMLSLAHQANDLGADGLLYDQLAGAPAQICYSSEHGHSVPGMSREKDATRFLKKIADEINAINPDFALFSEGLVDSQLNAITYFHSYFGNAHYTPPRDAVLTWIHPTGRSSAYGNFSEMFRYTYPEVQITVRNAIPMEHRRYANFAAVFGFNHEVESRYPADVTCLETGNLPSLSEYEANQITGLKLQEDQLAEFESVTAQTAFDYLRSVIEFQRQNEELLLEGRFVDTLGFDVSGDVIAKAFTSGNQIGVIVWNPDDHPVPFHVDVPGGTFLSASAPGFPQVAEPQGPLAPDSLRLLVWEKSGAEGNTATE